MRTFAGRLALIGATALVLRVAYVLTLAPDSVGRGDALFYHATANLLADGHGFVDPFEFPESARFDIRLLDPRSGAELAPTAAHPPLWPALLAVPSLLGGDGFTTHKLVGCVMGAVLVMLIGLVARRVAGPRTAVAAATLAAVYPVLIAADGSLMSEPLYGVGVAASLLLAYRALELPSVGRAALLGGALGLTALVRSEAVLLIPLLALPLLARGPAPPRARALQALAACAAAALVLVPWAARNWAAFDRPVLTSTNDGTVIGGANCDAAYGGSALGSWRLSCLDPIVERNEAKRTARWRSDGLDYIGEHPGRLPLVAVVRVLRTWDLYAPRSQARIAEARNPDVSLVGVLTFYALVPLSAVGLVLLRRRRAPLLPLLAPVALVTIVSVAGFGLPRFRHAAEIPLLVLAGVAAARTYELRTNRPARVAS